MTQGREAFGRKDYAAALKALSFIDDDAKTAAFEPLRSESQFAHDRSSTLRDTIKAAVAEQRLDGLLEIVDEYLSLKPGSPDLDTLRTKLVQRADQLATEKRLRAETLAAEKQARMRIMLRRFVGATCLLALLAGVALAATFWYQRQQAIAAAIASALNGKNWDDVLARDPGNATALLGRAQRKLSAGASGIDGAIADLDLAGRAGAPSGEIQKVRAVARIMDAERLIASNACHAADKSLAEAVSLGAEDRLVTGVRMKLARGWEMLCEKAIQDCDTTAFCTACEAARVNGASDVGLGSLWLRFGRQAVERADEAGVKAAIVGAEKYGLADPAIKSWKASATALRAVSIDSRSQRPQAIGKLRDAVLLDVAATTSVLRDGKFDGLRDAVSRDCREACQAAIAASKWGEAIRFASAVGMLDPGSAAWVAETVKSIPFLRNSIGMELRLLPAGTYTMGQAGSDSADETPHNVTLTSPFYIGVYEVTNAQWKRVMGKLPGYIIHKDDDLPVVKLHVSDAKEFCTRLSSLPEEHAAGRVYRLPTEAEWEYACRAGTRSRYSFGEDESLLSDYGWWQTNSGGKSHPIGLKEPNAWGLYDMHGNVSEWVSDSYGEYPKDAMTDPEGPRFGSYHHPCRGGAYGSEARWCRTAHRGGYQPDPQYGTIGFRLALSPSADHPSASSVGVEQTASVPVPKPEIACPGLGYKCNLSNGDWQGTWTRRGDTNEFDCHMTHSVGEIATYVAVIETGNKGMRVRRKNYLSSRSGPGRGDETEAVLLEGGKRLQFGHGVVERQY